MDITAHNENQKNYPVTNAIRCLTLDVDLNSIITP